MAKMTMHKELEMLRDEVEELKREKAAREKQAEIESQERIELDRQRVASSAHQIKEKSEEVEDELKEKLHEFSEAFKHDYENLSPVAAVFLFAIGAVFGHAISSK